MAIRKSGGNCELWNVFIIVDLKQRRNATHNECTANEATQSFFRARARKKKKMKATEANNRINRSFPFLAIPLVLLLLLLLVMPQANLEEARRLIRAIPDFPKPGILFQDIFPVFQSPSAFSSIITEMVHRIRGHSATHIVGLDARGFLFGPIIALQLGLPFVPIRKKGKLPGGTIEVGYEKEYGMDFFEIQTDALTPGAKCVIVDDLLATGGSATAAASLVEKAGAQTSLFMFVIGLQELGGSKLLQAKAPVISLFEL